MDEKDKQILELYLKDLKKKRLFFFLIIIIFVVSMLFYGFYAKSKVSLNEVDNSIQEEIENNIINENITKEENTTNNENTVDKENTESKVEKETKEDANEGTNDEKPKQETQEQAKANTQTNKTSSESKEKDTKDKPANKDFLFTDGYTMDNVTQAALDYLKSKDYSGECVPIKDNEGVYLGMRVVFY